MLVSTTDFTLDINIPNSDSPAMIEQLTGYINKYEPDYLTQLLGADLYTEFKAGLEEDPIPAKWQSLKDAITVEQIAMYIYWRFVRKYNSYLSGMNVTVKPKSENSNNVSPVDDMVYVWNQMVDASYKTVKFIQDNNADYGNYYLPDVGHYCYYGYWRFGCWRPDIFYKQNSLGI